MSDRAGNFIGARSGAHCLAVRTLGHRPVDPLTSRCAASSLKRPARSSRRC